MPKRRVPDDIDNHNNKNNSEPPSKRRRLMNNDPPANSWTNNNIFDHTEDQKQFDKIFNAIDSSQLIINNDIPHQVVHNISEFANHCSWITCYNCNEDISFIEQDKEEVSGIECPRCSEMVYWHWCAVCEHGHECTAQTRPGPHCDDCELTVCPALITKCLECDISICQICNTNFDKCWDCYQLIWGINHTGRAYTD